MNPSVLSQLTEPKDDIDKNIHDDFMGMYMLTDISRKQVEFRTNADTAGRVYQLWLNTGICLLKANAHVRNFKTLLEEKRKEFEVEVESDKSGNRQHFYWDLSVEVEGMLTQLKAALDSFAVVIGTAVGVSGIRGWSKKKPQGGTKKYSGQNIINVLSRNLPAQDLVRLQPLIDLLDDNKQQITDIVNTRDRFTHPNQLFMDFSTGFYYDSAKDEIIEPVILLGDQSYLQPMFVKMTYELIYNVLVYAGMGLLNGIALGMVMQKNNNQYNWYMVQPTNTNGI